MNAAVSFALLFVLGSQQTQAPLSFKVGDTIIITAPEGYGGTFTVLSDGAIYGKGWGRVEIAGLTWEDTQKSIRRALATFVKPDDVYVTIANQKRDVVYVVGLSGNQGPTTWEPGMTLRRLLSGTQFHTDLDQTVATLYRDQQKIFTSTLDRLLNDVPENDPLVKPGDVVAITSQDRIRVWVTGAVKSPGEVKIPVGSDLSRALAAAGGAVIQNGLEGGVDVLVRRGPNTMRYPARSVTELSAISVEAGDDVSVVYPEAVKVTVDGKVKSPGEYVVSGSSSISKAIAMAGGTSIDGTLAGVMIVRGQSMQFFDATNPVTNFELMSGDLVVVSRNERAFYVFGEVNSPGQFKMEDGKAYRVMDALAAAGGLGSRGVLRRVFFAQRGTDGKVVVSVIAPDEYLRHGELAHNPIIKPGDSLLFTRSNGLSISAAVQVLTSLVLIDSLGRN